MVTMVDVAERAGVSVSTVSHVLNGTRTVADATRQRVLRSVEELAYVPNHVARSLVRSSSRQLGLAISIGPTTYFGGLVHAIDTAARAAGYLVMLANTEDEADQERVVVDAAAGSPGGRSADGSRRRRGADARPPRRTIDTGRPRRPPPRRPLRRRGVRGDRNDAPPHRAPPRGRPHAHRDAQRLGRVDDDRRSHRRLPRGHDRRRPRPRHTTASLAPRPPTSPSRPSRDSSNVRPDRPPS